jgi:Mg/Co/Ni transporter MgtE
VCYSDKIPIIIHQKLKQLITYKKILQLNQGIDERFPLERKNREKEEILYNIMKNSKKKELLDYLESKQISIIAKIQEIEKREELDKELCRYKPNLFAGSLLEEWSDLLESIE